MKDEKKMEMDETKEHVYQEHKPLFMMATQLIMTNPPMDKVLDILKMIGATTYAQGKADGAELIVKMHENLNKSKKVIEEALK